MTIAPSSAHITGPFRTSPPRVAVGLSLVLPMYNERDNVGRTLAAAVAALQDAVDDFEIIVVDDGSTDGSANLVAAWQARVPQIRLIHHSTNRGYGAALRSGFAAASQTLVMYTDMDLPCDLQVIHQILPLFDRADMVIGYRQPYGEPGMRWLRSRMYNWLLRWLFGLRLHDVNFSCKAFRSDLMRHRHLRSSSCLIDAELLLSARQLQYRIVEIPVRYQHRQQERSKLSSLGADLALLREMWTQYRALRSHHGDW